MDDVIITFSVVYTIILLLEKIAFVDGHSCKNSTVDGKLFVDCSGLSQNKLLLTVPDDIDPKVEYLDLSWNIFKEMKESSFKKYENLIRLTTRDTKVKALVDNYLFRPLTKLEELDISGITFEGSLPLFYWPANIKKLNISNTKYGDLNAADLTKLEIVDASNNRMDSFPYFNRKSPIHTVNLNGNTLNGLRIQHLAPYCHIKKLSMELSDESDLLSPPKYCDCVWINLWMKQFGIESNNLECQEKNADEVCNKEFPEDVLKKRRECFEAKVSQSQLFVLIFVIALILLLTLLTLIFAYRYVKLRRRVQPVESAESSIDEDESIAEEGISR